MNIYLLILNNTDPIVFMAVSTTERRPTIIYDKVLSNCLVRSVTYADLLFRLFNILYILFANIINPNINSNVEFHNKYNTIIIPLILFTYIIINTDIINK